MSEMKRVYVSIETDGTLVYKPEASCVACAEHTFDHVLCSDCLDYVCFHHRIKVSHLEKSKRYVCPQCNMKQAIRDYNTREDKE